MPYLGNSEIQSIKNCNLKLSLYLTFNHRWWTEDMHKITVTPKHNQFCDFSCWWTEIFSLVHEEQNTETAWQCM